MIKFIEYPSIDQFRTVVKDLTHAEFIGLNEFGESMYDRTKPKPIINFTGTTKIHGTNGALCLHDTDFWCQSRTRIISVTDDNMGFCKFAEDRKQSIDNIFDQIKMS